MKPWIMASVSAVLAALSPPVLAQTCEETVAELFTTGPINPFNRPPWRDHTVQINEDGSETHIVDAAWQSPSRVQSFAGGTYIIAIGSDTWTAGAMDGPWTAAGATLPDDVDEFHRRQNEALMRNMTEISCPGTVTVDGREMVKYVYRTKTDPNEYGSWFGGLYSSFVDIETGLLMRVEIRESIASWAPDPTKDIKVTTLEYDPTIKIDPPG